MAWVGSQCDSYKLSFFRNDTGTQPPAEQNGSCSPCEEEDGEGEERFWKEPVPYTPESRTEMHSYMAEKMKEKNKEPE